MATPQDLLRQAGRNPSYSQEAKDWRQQRKEQQAKAAPSMTKPAQRPNPVGTQRPQEPMTKFPTNPMPPGGASPPILAMPPGGQVPNMGRFDPNPVNSGDMGPGSVGPGMGIQQLGGANGPMPPDMKYPGPGPGISGSSGGPPPPSDGPGMSVGPIGGSMPPGGAQGFGIGAPPPGMSQAPGMDSGGGGNPFPGFRPGPPPGAQLNGAGLGAVDRMGGPQGGVMQPPPQQPSPFAAIGHIAGRMQPPQFMGHGGPSDTPNNPIQGLSRSGPQGLRPRQAF